MRILISGAHGQVGHELLRRAAEGFEVHGLGSSELDIGSAEQVREVFERLRPQLIINAAAYTAVDKAESDSARAHAVNRDGAAHLADCGVPVLHISTDYVFAGDARQPYRETDGTAPQGVYGASKLAGEQELARRNQRYVILRTAWVFGAHGNNFVKTMLRLASQRDRLGVVADQRGGPTPAAAIADALWNLASRYRRQGELAWGTYHFSGAPDCTWHDFAQEIFRLGLELGLLSRIPQVDAIATADYPTPARRPAWSVLDGTRLRQVYGIEQPDWREGLRQVLQELAASAQEHQRQPAT